MNIFVVERHLLGNDLPSFLIDLKILSFKYMFHIPSHCLAWKRFAWQYTHGHVTVKIINVSLGVWGYHSIQNALSPQALGVRPRQNSCSTLVMCWVQICWITSEFLDILSCLPIISMRIVMLYGGSPMWYCTLKSEAFPIVRQIACRLVVGLCMKDNNMFASCEATRNLS